MDDQHDDPSAVAGKTPEHDESLEGSEETTDLGDGGLSAVN